ncbi:armadillo repeat-containing protein 1-like [Emydura macquarii macquarii]|uniref:armadillo repeat-containing protein 1-like n=1 Tax=Emydura macquarii macquarii TaxID=1129001 RepID=UPI00352B6C65
MFPHPNTKSSAFSSSSSCREEFSHSSSASFCCCWEKLQSLASAVAATKVLEAQVIRCEARKEIFIPCKTVNVIKNSHLPDYLPEEENPRKEIEKGSFTNWNTD